MNQYKTLHTLALRTLDVHLRLMDKIEAHVQEHGMKETELLGASLAPDMFPFVKQVQITSDAARRNLLYLAGKDDISMPDTEISTAELRERIKKTHDIVKSLQECDFDGADDRKISLFWMGGDYMLGKDFVTEVAIPNLMFHTVTAYGILRSKGINIGKADFLGSLSMKRENTNSI